MSRSEEFVTTMLSTAKKQPIRTPMTHIQVFNGTASSTPCVAFAAIEGFIVVVAKEVLLYFVATVTTDDMPGDSRFS